MVVATLVAPPNLDYTRNISGLQYYIYTREESPKDLINLVIVLKKCD
jgi:hypothetical protein